MPETIAAVVVTFNRLTLLKECIEGLRHQTHKLDSIIVINNGSTDGTDKWLNEQFDLKVIHQENLGGAGGFARGMKEAYNAGFEWIWVMDDDVEPLSEGLSDLLKFINISKCLHGLKLDLQGNKIVLERYLDFRTGFCYGANNLSDLSEKEYFFITTACFEGMLINRDVIDKIGFPNINYFINGDDTMYGFMASRFTNVICITKPVLRKKISKPYNKTFWGGDLESSAGTLYYFYRNKFLIKNELKSMGFSVDRFMSELLRRTCKDLLKTLLSFNFKHFKYILKGIYDGYNGYFGK